MLSGVYFYIRHFIANFCGKNIAVVCHIFFLTNGITFIIDNFKIIYRTIFSFINTFGHNLVFFSDYLYYFTYKEYSYIFLLIQPKLIERMLNISNQTVSRIPDAALKLKDRGYRDYIGTGSTVSYAIAHSY